MEAQRKALAFSTARNTMDPQCTISSNAISHQGLERATPLPKLGVPTVKRQNIIALTNWSMDAEQPIRVLPGLGYPTFSTDPAARSWPPPPPPPRKH